MALKLSHTTFPIFAPPIDPNPNPRPSSELRVSRWNKSDTRSYNSPNVNRTSRSPVRNKPSSGSNSKPTGEAPSHPAFRFSNLPKSRRRPVTGAPEKIKISEDGVSYIVDGAPFEFKYSYTETPKVKPLKMREEQFVPFGPDSMPRPWTGRAPLPPSKKKLKEFDSFVLPPPHKKGVKPVQSPGPFLPGTSPRYVKTREELLGEPLTTEELNDLIRGCIKSKRLLSVGRDGLTHNMLDNIHAHWKRRRVCKIKCKGVCTVDMDNVCQQLEERTGGEIIYRRGGVLFLFRGRNYNYRTRPRFPLMLWKPASPVYPRLIKRVPEGLTLEEATEMRRKGSTLIPICKLGKNGVYFSLVKDVREAFEECELVRINCQGLNRSDYRKIGAKLRDLIPCTLLSFENEHILMWRGSNWKSSIPDLGNDCKEVNEIEVGDKNYETMQSEAMEFSEPCLENNPEGHTTNSSHDASISSSSSDVSLDEVEVPYPIGNSKQSMFGVTDVSSLPESCGVETTNNATGSYGEPEPCSSTSPSMAMSHYNSHVEFSSKAMSDSHTGDIMDSKSCSDGLSASISRSDIMVGSSDSDDVNGMVDPHADKFLAGLGETHVSQPSRSAAAPCMNGVLLLLEQAVEKGSALVLDEDETSLDADNIYQTTVTFAKSAPPGPVFRKHRKLVAQKSTKKEVSTLETKENATVSVQRKKEKSTKIPRKQNFDDQLLNVVPQGTLGVDELAKLLT